LQLRFATAHEGSDGSFGLGHDSRRSRISRDGSCDRWRRELQSITGWFRLRSRFRLRLPPVAARVDLV